MSDEKKRTFGDKVREVGSMILDAPLRAQQALTRAGQGVVEDAQRKTKCGRTRSDSARMGEDMGEIGKAYDDCMKGD